MARDYKRERLIEKPERKQQRSDRNKARAVMEKALGAAAISGKEVHHSAGVVTGKPRLADLQAVKPAVHNHGRGGSQGGKLKKR
jgi:hypothetical protein